MPRTRAQIEQAARDAEAWLDSLTPDDLAKGEDPVDLRQLGAAVVRRADAETDVAAAVAACREAGRTWSEIGLVLGVSKQAARQTYGQTVAT